MKRVGASLFLISMGLVFFACSSSTSILLKTKTGDTELFESLEVDSSIFSSSKVTFNTSVGIKEFPKSFEGISSISIIDVDELIKKLDEERKEQQAKIANSNKTNSNQAERFKNLTIGDKYSETISRLRMLGKTPVIEVTYKSTGETYRGPCEDLKDAMLVGYTKTGKQSIPFSRVSQIIF